MSDATAAVISDAAEPAVLVGQELRHGYGQSSLFNSFSYGFAPGLTAVVGPNGSGKTTLLRILGGLMTPRDGQVQLRGTPLSVLSSGERARLIAYLPQSTPLYFDMPSFDVVLMGRAPHRGRWRNFTREDRRVAQDCLAQVGLDPRTHGRRGVLSLSGGEKQRVMLARLLATEADVLILDEPTTGLDIGHALSFLELLKRPPLSERTVVMAVHELEWARRFAEQALCLCGGEVHCGPVSDTLADENIERAFGVKVQANSALGFTL